MDSMLLPILMLVLSVSSLTMLYSITPQLVANQAMFFLLGVGVFVVSALFSFDLWKYLAKIGYGVLLVLLVFTLVLGKTAKGSTRWFSIGFVQAQPSQFIKPMFAIVLAAFLTQWALRSPKAIAKFLALTGIPIMLVFLQPDLGTALVLVSITLAEYVVSSIPKKVTVFLVSISLILMILIWRVALKQYQKQRVLDFLSPSEHEQSSGYNRKQAVITIGSGGVFGRGLGNGVQSHLRFLPEKHTDFMFASLTEELGFFGGFAIIICYCTLLLYILRIAKQAKQREQAVFCMGIFGMLSFQIIENIGMNLGLLPITGITLPLLSYGGSSILTVCLSLGIVYGIAKRKQRESVIEIR